jgi:hypothetical protein
MRVKPQMPLLLAVFFCRLLDEEISRKPLPRLLLAVLPPRLLLLEDCRRKPFIPLPVATLLVRTLLVDDREAVQGVNSGCVLRELVV